MTFEWTTDFSLGGLEPAGTMEWQTVKSWASFTHFFEDAVHIDVVTYCESPELLLELFDREDFHVDSMDVLVGNRDEFQSTIDDRDVVERLVEYYQDEKLVIRLKNKKVIHSKLYRIENADGTVTLLSGSANLSYNSWRNQTNSITAFHVEAGSELDKQFQRKIADHRAYSNTVFLEELVDELQATTDEEEYERKIELWVAGRDTTLTERAELHAAGNEEIETLAANVDQTVSVLDSPESADDSVAVTLEGTNADGTISVNEGTVKLEGTASTTSPSTTSDTDSITTDTAEAIFEDSQPPITAARTNDYRISLSTREYESQGYADTLGRRLQQREATVGEHAITTTLSAYTSFVKDEYDVPVMSVDVDEERVVLQHKNNHRILTARTDPSPADIDDALANIEAYLETVDRWGTTNNETAVKAHMYEGLLYGLWAPFINLYATDLYHRDVTLDNALQYLYIYGESDAGKDIFTEFLLRLISDGLVHEGADADKTKKKSFRALRDIDTTFPYVVSDITQQEIQSYKNPLANFWQQWQPDSGVSYPTIIFTSNDTRPKDWFRNRAKMLHFDVTFPSNPEDEDWQAAQEDLNPILNTRNYLFAWVSQRLLREKPYREGRQTIGDIRNLVLSFYDEADREVPEYFPQKPANREYNIGKRKWRNAYDRGDISFEWRDKRLLAHFDLDKYEVHQYRKTLPTKMRPMKSGRTVIIKNPSAFVEWLDRDTRQGLLTRVRNVIG